MQAQKQFASVQAAYQAAIEAHRESQRQQEETTSAWQQGLLHSGFSDESAYLAARLTDEAIVNIERQIAQYEERSAMLSGEQQALSRKLAEKNRPELEPLLVKVTQAEEKTGTGVAGVYATSIADGWFATCRQATGGSVPEKLVH